MSVTQLGFAHDIDRANGKEEWLTPPELIKSLGEFDLDPCSPINRPWPIAKEHYTISDNGLVKPWIGRVWCNPPYGPETGKWMARCMAHKNCTALIFARTETRQFFEYVWGGGLCGFVHQRPAEFLSRHRPARGHRWRPFRARRV